MPDPPLPQVPDSLQLLLSGCCAYDDVITLTAIVILPVAAGTVTHGYDLLPAPCPQILPLLLVIWSLLR